MAINKEQVFAVADKMFSEGTAPTLISIRKEIGSGSFSTISGMLAEWKSASRKGDAVPDVDLPEELRDAVDAAGARIWAFALKLAQDDAQLTKDESRELVQLATDTRDEALQLATDLQVENDRMIDQVFRLQAQIETAKSEQVDLAREVAMLRVRAESAEAAFRMIAAKLPNKVVEALVPINPKGPLAKPPKKVVGK
jgi:hypothetical protein